ncbi:cupin domain-containing protein [Kribbella sp. CA-294648]|uniref:cupin domain-containing protein n=1 Tax=Kribbella sp. CA-294648 TaxID=3239948 RepID=UPI003D9164F5
MTTEESGVVPPVVRVVGDWGELVDDSTVPAGARWTLAEVGRQLDANLIHLPAGQRVDTHTEPDLDVLLVAVAGSGTVGTPDGVQAVAKGNLVWLPRGSTRNLTAGPDGFSYLTVHRRRPGMQIKQRPGE